MVINVKNLSKIYKIKKRGDSLFRLFSREYTQFEAVNDVSFSVQKGESVALLGPNGAGKTTIMKMLTGLIYPSSGKIEVLGFTPFDKNSAFLKRIGLVMGNKSGLEWDLTPRQSFQLYQKIYELTDEKFQERVEALTTLLSIKNFMDTQVRKLSLGERLKMEIAAALLHDPEVLFLDEPTIGLDVISKQKVREFLRTIQKETHVTLLLTSHDMDDIEKVCDRVIVINHGKKIYDNTLSKLTSHHKKERYIRVIFKKMPESLDIPEAKLTETGDDVATYKISHKHLASFLSFVTKKFDILDVDILSIPLDEIIADLFQGKEK